MKKKFYIILILFILGGSFVLFNFNSKQSVFREEGKREKLNVLVSILPQKTFVEEVAGDLVRVKVLIPPGGSPATYELKPSDLVNVEKADIYFRVGYIPFEKVNLNKINNLNKKMKVVDTSGGIKLRHFKSTGAIDPHIWVAPREVKKQIDTIEQTLEKVDFSHKDIYRQNAARFKKKLERLDTVLKSTFANLKNNKIMVFHPSWGYLADDYGLEQVSIEDSGKEPTAEQLKKIIDKAKQENIKVIFVQAQFNKDVAKAIAKEIQATVVSIDPLAEDYINNLENIAKIIAQGLSKN
jgi:zinc transport system substrate-binding protein